MADDTTGQQPPAQPTPEDINWLKSDPANGPAFEDAFGQGSAQQYSAPPAADPNAPPASQRDALDYTADVVKGVGRGALKAVDETSKTVTSGLNFAIDKAGGGKDFLSEPLQYADLLGTKAPDTVPGRIAEGVSQFGFGMLGAGKLLKLKQLAELGWAGKAAVGAARGAVVDFTAFDPHQERLSNLLENLSPDSQDAWYTYLASKPGDTEIEGRLKNTVEGMGLGVAAEGVFYGLRAMKARLTGTDAEAAKALEDLPAGTPPPEPVPSTADASARQGDEALKDPVTGEMTPKPEAKPVTPLIPVVEKSLLDDITNEVMARDSVGADTNLPYRLDKHLDTPAGAIRLISAVTDRLVEQGDKVPIKDIVDQANQLAFSLSTTPEALLHGITSSNEPGRMAAEVLARQKVLDLAGTRADRALNAMLDSSGDGAAAAKTEYQRSVEELAVAAQVASSSRSEAGRTLRALRENGAPSDALVQKVNNLSPDRLRELRSMMLGVVDPVAKRRLMLEALTKPTGWETAVKVWRNVILSNPATHMVNAASNTFNLGQQYAEELMTGMYAGNKVQRNAGAAGFVDAFGGLMDAVKASGAAWKTGRGIIDPAAHSVDNPEAATTASKDLAALYSNVQEGDLWKAHLTATKALLGDGALRTLGASDEFFKQIAYNSRIKSQAWAEGSAAGLKDKDLSAFIDSKVQASVDPRTGQGINQDALNFSREATFTQDLGDDTVISQLGQKLQRLTNGRDGVSLALQTILPFVKTPANVLDNFWQRSPLNMQLYKDMTSSDVQVAANAKARLTVGATYTATAMGLVAADKITGGGPASPELRKIWKQDHQPYSIKIGDTWFGYNRFDPSGTHFGVLADMAEIAKHIPDRDAGDLFKMTATAFARQFQNKTFLRGASDFFAAMTDNTGNDQQRWATNFVSSAVPAFLSAFKSDPVMRDARTMLDGIRSRLPGYSEHLDPQRDIMGNPVMASEVGGWSPIGITTDTHNETYQRIFDAFDKSGEVISPPPRQTNGIDWTSYKIDRNDLGRRQSAYDRVGELMQEQGTQAQLDSTVRDGRFKDAAPQQQVEIVRSILGANRRAAEAKVMADPRFKQLQQDSLVARAKSKGVSDYQRLLNPPAPAK